MSFKKATKRNVRPRIALMGPTGSGKTFWALMLAKRFGKKIAVIDTERQSASNYTDFAEFDVDELPTFSVENYIASIDNAVRGGYDVLIIDSLSHAWAGKDGVLQFVDEQTRKSASKNAYTEGWRKASPLHNDLVEKILTFPGTIIITMRVKMAYELIENEKKQKVPVRIGLQPIQRDSIEYEFQIICDVDLDHHLMVAKTRVWTLADKMFRPASKPHEANANEFFDLYEKWAADAAPAEEATDVERPPDLVVLRNRCAAGERHVYVGKDGMLIPKAAQNARHKYLDVTSLDQAKEAGPLQAYLDHLLEKAREAKAKPGEEAA